jgi:hypothetical protein
METYQAHSYIGAPYEIKNEIFSNGSPEHFQFKKQAFFKNISWKKVSGLEKLKFVKVWGEVPQVPPPYNYDTGWAPYLSNMPRCSIFCVETVKKLTAKKNRRLGQICVNHH